MRKLSVEALVDGLTEGNRGCIARAITLVESTKPAHREQAHQLLQTIAPLTGKAFRVGISGSRELASPPSSTRWGRS